MGFKGINIVERRGAANKPVIGFRGIVVGLQLNLPVTVRDSRGRGLANVLVSIANPSTSDPFESITDSLGNCLVKADTSNPNPVTVTRGKLSKTVNYTTGNSFTIIFDNSKPPFT
jgi:hypothetical protein